MGAEALRQLFTRHRFVRLREVYRRMGAESREDRKKVDVALHQLRRQGEVETIEPGCYRATGRGSAERPAPLLEKCWQAMRNLRRFTRADIVEVTGASWDYVRHYLRSLRWQDYVRVVGRKTHGHGCPAVYQVVCHQVAAPPLLRQRFRAGKPVLVPRLTISLDT